MTLGIMQPYFFPYPGYFSLIEMVDHFILFDTPQYIRHGWIDRNRVLKNEKDFLYIQPAKIKHSNRIKINDILLKNEDKWREKIISQLNIYRKAPHYDEIISFLQNLLAYETNSLSDFNEHALKEICNYLNIRTPISSLSKMNIEIIDANVSDEWALNICRALDSKHYINPIGGANFFNPKKYAEAGILLQFMEYCPKPYRQFGDSFIPNLSIIDMMFFCDNHSISEMLKSFKIQRIDS